MSVAGTEPIISGAVAFASLFCGITYATVAPRSQIWCRLTYRGCGSRPRVALTFDDGPVAGATDRVLDILAAEKVKATFFVIGEHVERSPQLLRRIDDEGHLVGNHSYEHLHWGFARGRGYWREELRRTDELIERIIGKRPTLFRPPMGIKTWRIASAARHHGHRIITWTRRARDGVGATSQQIVSRLTDDASPGDILVLHDGVDPRRPRDRAATVAALHEVIDRLRQRELQPVSYTHLTLPTNREV